MRYRVLLVLFLVGASAFALRAEDDAPKPPPVGPPTALDTLDKRVSYALGHQFGASFRSAGGTLDADAYMRGLHDGFEAVTPVMSDVAMNQAIMECKKILQAKQQEKQKEAMAKLQEQGKKNKIEGPAFLEKNKTAEGVQVTSSGLQYKVLVAGTGAKPAAIDTVVVDYEGKFLDGTVFDASSKHPGPSQFRLAGGVIKGWTEGLQLMPVGSTYEFYIPSELAYGEAGRREIPPSAVLIFKIELKEIRKMPVLHPPVK